MSLTRWPSLVMYLALPLQALQRQPWTPVPLPKPPQKPPWPPVPGPPGPPQHIYHPPFGVFFFLITLYPWWFDIHNDVSVCESFSVIVKVTQLAPCDSSTNWSLTTVVLNSFNFKFLWLLETCGSLFNSISLCKKLGFNFLCSLLVSCHSSTSLPSCQNLWTLFLSCTLFCFKPVFPLLLF